MHTVWIFVLCILLTTTVSAQTTATAFEKGTRAANAGNYQKALEHYRDALEQFRSARDLSADFTAQIHYNIGVCFYHLNQPAAAIQEYAAAIKLSNGNYQKAFHAKAMAEVELKNWQAARKDFEEALLLNQRDGESWFDLAMVFVAEKDYQRAAAAFKESIANKSISSPAGHNNLGVILAFKGSFSSAQKEFETALFESKLTLIEAKKNLEFCRARIEKWNQVSLTKLEFSPKTQTKD